MADAKLVSRLFVRALSIHDQLLNLFACLVVRCACFVEIFGGQVAVVVAYDSATVAQWTAAAAAAVGFVADTAVADTVDAIALAFADDTDAAAFVDAMALVFAASAAAAAANAAVSAAAEMVVTEVVDVETLVLDAAVAPPNAFATASLLVAENTADVLHFAVIEVVVFAQIVVTQLES